MRTVFGAVALCVGGFLTLAALFVALKLPGLLAWLGITSGCLAAVLVVAGAVLLRNGNAPERGLAIGLALLGGAVGLGFAIGSKNHTLGKYCGIEGHNQEYTLTVRIFGSVLRKETGPAVQQGLPGNSVVGPSRELETAMAWWEVGLDAALVASGALVGATISSVVGRLRGRAG